MAKRRKKKKLTAEEKRRRRQVRLYTSQISRIFTKSGFKKVPSIYKQFEFKGKKGEIDSLFIYENVLIVVEDTYTAQTRDIIRHLTGKIYLFELIRDNKEEFIQFLETEFPTFAAIKNPIYEPHHYQVVLLYCSRYDFDNSYKLRYPFIKFFDYPILRYFLNISSVLKKSARYELLNFLELSYENIGESIIKSSLPPNVPYNGSVLPESFSNFKSGFKVVTFYIDPESLIRRSYVLRSEGWQDTEGVYQRMIIKSKLNKMRKYLYINKRVFINNIIVTLPSETKLIQSSGNELEKTFTKTKPVQVNIPEGFNNIGIIDGQHRIYAYHEGDDQFEDEISNLRKKQNLLVTGIKYPPSISRKEKGKFEAKLFLEINATQSTAKSNLKQSIELLIHPFSSIAISKAIISRLSSEGPLANYLEVYFFETDKIKTSSIVSYGLKPLVKFSGNDSLYSLWSKRNKKELTQEKNYDLLDEYISYCVKKINDLLSGYKKNIPSDLWSPDRKVSLLLTPTSINGLINCLRLLIENGKTGDLNYYAHRLKGINNFKFKNYKSSQWRSLGLDLFNKYFR